MAGAKQNRILERSILVAPGAKLEIPVRCLEQGRWAYRLHAFAAAPRAVRDLDLSLRDAGELLGLSYQRVLQLVRGE